MSAFDWQDVLMDEAEGLPVDKPVEDLPTDNEEKPEDNGWDSPASGDLPEEEDPNGMKDVPRGTDPITGNDSKEYDDLMDIIMDEDESEGDKSEDDDKSDDSKDDDSDKGDDKEDDKEDEEDTKDEYLFDSFFYDEAGGLPMDPVKEDLPSDNEKEGEDNGWDSPAAGDLPEDDTDPGMKDVPRGEDPITGTKSNEYDDLMDIIMDKDDEEEDDKSEDDEKSDDDDKKEEQGEDKGSDDDGASEDGDTKDEYVDDFSDFFVDSVGEETPDADGAGADLEPADPVDGDGKKVDPIGDPDLPSNLTEPVLVPADDPQYATKDELMDVLREDVRFSFGDF